MYKLTIDGLEVESGSVFDVEDPATEEVCGHAPECTPDQLESAVAAAARAYQSWCRVDLDERARALESMANALGQEVERLAWLLTTEQGKPLGESRRELALACDRLRHYAGIEAVVTIVRDDEVARVEVVRNPIGPVAVMTPWNSPIITAINRVAPALWAGNTVVLKPSPYAPLTALAMGQVLSRCLPDGVLNVVSGSGASLGEALVRHLDVAKVAFTGSVTVGRQIAEAMGRTLRPSSLELGGNDPAIILEDADVAMATRRIFWNAFTNCGQICVAVKRVYAPASRYDDVVECLAQEAEGAVVGDGRDEGTQIGPLGNKAQADRVAALVSEALAAGAVAAVGGSRIDRIGHFHQPTILRDVDDGVRVVDEEQFGPVLPVIRYDNIADAVRRANATGFGLGGSVWGQDLDTAREVAGLLECGLVWINNHRALAATQPFGGIKDSGVVGPTFGIDEFTNPKVVWSGR